MYLCPLSIASSELEFCHFIASRYCHREWLRYCIFDHACTASHAIEEIVEPVDYVVSCLENATSNSFHTIFTYNVSHIACFPWTK